MQLLPLGLRNETKRSELFKLRSLEHGPTDWNSDLGGGAAVQITQVPQKLRRGSPGNWDPDL